MLWCTLPTVRSEDLVNWRKEAGLTQGQVAQRVGVTRWSVIAWERPGVLVPQRRHEAIRALFKLGPAVELAPKGPDLEVSTLVRDHGLGAVLSSLSKACVD